MSSLKCGLVVLAIFLLSSVISSPILPNSSIDKELLLSNSIIAYDLSSNTSQAIREKQSELMQSYMDTSVDPCENFYDYACGNWEKHNPIPKDKWKHSTTVLLHNNLQQKLKELLSEPIDGLHDDDDDELKPPLSAIVKAKLLYKSCMDQEAKMKLGTEPLLKFINELGGWPVLKETNWKKEEFDWLKLAINTTSFGNGILIGFDILKSPKNPKEYTIFLKQGTLGMVNRDNYLKKENSKNLETYRVLVKKVLRLLNVDEQKALNFSNQIVDFEVLLAKAMLPLEASKTEKYYQLDVDKMSSVFWFINWEKYISGVQGTEVKKNQTVVIQLGVKYFENLVLLLLKTKCETLANYMIWRSVLFLLPNLDSRFGATFDEFVSIVTGQVEPDPLWTKCVTQVNSVMGMATSGMFIRKYFDESSKNETIKIINSLKETFDENLPELDWIDASTKAYASEKANAIVVAAGYPDYIRSEAALDSIYKEINVVKGEYFENCLSVVKHNLRKSRERLFRPYDKNEWAVVPTNVNALYDSQTNRIMILAGILQAPFFHQHFPQSLNYGAMGFFMGHEIIHGFDDSGRHFDAVGNYFNWWTPEAKLNFEEKKKCFLEEYENFAKQDESFKSIATVSENLADNGGIRLAYKTYSKWKQLNSPDAMKYETFPNMKYNADQLFFLNFAQTLCEATRPEALIESRSFKVHTPGRHRVLGALVNFEKFSETFNCPIGTRLNPKTKCRLW